MSNREDFQLVNKILNNENRAFDMLVMKYKNMIFNLCFRILNDYEDANDCSQETFIKVFKNLKKFKFKSSLSTWIYRIAVNTCKNKLNSLEFRLKKNRVKLNDATAEYQIDNVILADNTYKPDDKAVKNEMGKIVLETINKLPELQKIIIVLRDIENKSYDEICLITGLKLGTLKSKLSRAREKLKKLLEGVIDAV